MNTKIGIKHQDYLHEGMLLYPDLAKLDKYIHKRNNQLHLRFAQKSIHKHRTPDV